MDLFQICKTIIKNKKNIQIEIKGRSVMHLHLAKEMECIENGPRSPKGKQITRSNYLQQNSINNSKKLKRL